MNDESQDFWPLAFSECTPTFDCHVITFSSPEPGSFVLFGIGILGMAWCRWMLRKNAA